MTPLAVSIPEKLSLALLQNCSDVKRRSLIELSGGGGSHQSAYGRALRPYITARQLEHRAKKRMWEADEIYGTHHRVFYNPETMEPRTVNYYQMYDDAIALSEQCKATTLAELQEL
jgi:hypothetical protein